MRHSATAALLMALAMQPSARTPTSRPLDPVFEVVSIKPSGPDGNPACQPPTCYSSFFVPQQGRFKARRMSVSGLVGYAYSMPMNRIVGPEWTTSEQYDIEATHGLPTSDQAGLRVMVQRLLRERFSFQMHREQRRMGVYVLLKARDDGRLGPQLVSTTGCDDRPSFLPSVYGKSCGGIGVPSATSRVGLGMWANLRLDRQLEPYLDRPVVDETGLSGWFALFWEWSDALQASPPATLGTPSSVPQLFVALREQLGLKVERTERPLEVIVIDTVGRPVPN